MPETLTPNMFDAVKDKLKKSYYNKFIKPSTLTKYAECKFSNHFTVIIFFSGI